MSQENVEIVRRAYDVVFAQGNVEGVVDRFAPGFVWHQRDEWPGRPTYAAAEMPQLWADLSGTYPDMRLEPVEFVDAGDYVVVTVATSSGIRGSDTTRVEAKIWHVWHMRDGLAVEGWAYADQAEALRTAGLPDVSAGPTDP